MVHMAVIISIHAAHEGCDRSPITLKKRQRKISIHAARVSSDYHFVVRKDGSIISIHAAKHYRRCAGCFNFNPRCPCGQRPLYRKRNAV